MSEYTKGPWSVMFQNSRAVEYPGYQGWQVPIQCGAHGVNGGPGNVLAIVHMGGPGATSSTKESVEANARIIAAAPELLDAAEDALRELDFCVEVAGRRGGLYEKARDGLRAAIAKAKGGAS